jgi:hypothetical protein
MKLLKALGKVIKAFCSATVGPSLVIVSSILHGCVLGIIETASILTSQIYKKFGGIDIRKNPILTAVNDAVRLSMKSTSNFFLYATKKSLRFPGSVFKKLIAYANDTSDKASSKDTSDEASSNDTSDEASSNDTLDVASSNDTSGGASSNDSSAINTHPNPDVAPISFEPFVVSRQQGKSPS